MKSAGDRIPAGAAQGAGDSDRPHQALCHRTRSTWWTSKRTGARRLHRAAIRTRPPGGCLPARRPLSHPGQRVHDRRSREGGRRADRHRLHAAAGGRHGERRRAVLRLPVRCRPDLSSSAASRRWPPWRSACWASAGRHAGRRRQRVRRRGEASAVRHGLHRPAGRPVGGRGDRRRHRRLRPSWPRTSSARPSTAPTSPAALVTTSQRARSRGDRRGDRQLETLATRISPARPGATTAR